MTDLMKKAVDALRPFAILADLADELPAHLRDDRTALLSLGKPMSSTLRVRHLRAARAVLAELETAGDVIKADS